MSPQRLLILILLTFCFVFFLGCPGERDDSTPSSSTTSKKKKDRGVTYPDTTVWTPVSDSGILLSDSGNIIYWPDQSIIYPDTSNPSTLGEFGDRCSEAKPCNTSKQLLCIKETANAAEGSCTKPCQNPGGDCTDYPTGTFAGCLRTATVSGYSGYICAFVCRDQAEHWSCPSTLNCVTTDNPDIDGCIP